MQAVSVATMQALDAQAIGGLGIPRLILMEHAGIAVARAVVSGGKSGPVVVCCGRGYNGGDGLAATRHLLNRGYAVQVVLTAALESLRDEPRTFAQVLRQLDVPMTVWPDDADPVRAWLQAAGVVVDALLGIGVQSVVREPLASLIEAINTSPAWIVAADVPSGLDADTGQVLGTAVKAHHTVSFGLAKEGCLAPVAKSYVGRLQVDPISFPPLLLERALRGQVTP
jgi:NAD(P)H-hydrate epimerase